MPRRPRKLGEKLYHHIYAWGNNRQAIFITDEHYEKYLNFLERYSTDNQIEVIAYALMQSHIHLFVYDQLRKVSQFMNSLHGEYAQYFNRVTGRVGHVFGERFNNKIVQANEYGLWLSRYIHRQAVEAGFVTDPRYYQWTSYHKYLGAEPLGFIKPDVILEQFGVESERVRNYTEFVVGAADGPVDWNVKSSIVVGNKKFKEDVLAKQVFGKRRSPSTENIFRLVSERFRVDHELLSNARGLEEKRLRREIVRFLVEVVGLRRSSVAHLCHLTCMAVQKMLNPKV
ncbi:MAG: transposase [candidate division WOR-3 bacterium]|nr:MAG: transposase [candidate division WOR-3 bacterium]